MIMEQTQKDIKFLSDMRELTQSLLTGKYNVAKLEMLDKMIDDWQHDLSNEEQEKKPDILITFDEKLNRYNFEGNTNNGKHAMSFYKYNASIPADNLQNTLQSMKALSLTTEIIKPSNKQEKVNADSDIIETCLKENILKHVMQDDSMPSYKYNFHVPLSDIIKSVAQKIAYDFKVNEARVKQLEGLINNPILNDFIDGVKVESAHQTERWGQDVEEQNYPHHYVMVMTKLLGKLTTSIWDKDVDKFKHHCITASAVLYNCHRQINKKGTATNKYFLSKSND